MEHTPGICKCSSTEVSCRACENNFEAYCKACECGDKELTRECSGRPVGSILREAVALGVSDYYQKSWHHNLVPQE